MTWCVGATRCVALDVDGTRWGAAMGIECGTELGIYLLKRGNLVVVY